MLQAGLENNFAEVQVSVVECPDLTKDPFLFPVKGKSPHFAHHTLNTYIRISLRLYKYLRGSKFAHVFILFSYNNKLYSMYYMQLLNLVLIKND